MTDIALFPVPITEKSDDDLPGQVYRATQVSLGATSVGDIITLSDSDLRTCTQKVLKILLTRKGSVPSQQNYGTNLLNLLRVGYNPDSINEDVIMILIDAQTQCTRQDNIANTPLSARLGSIELLDLVLLDAGQLRLSIGVTTTSGQAASFDLQV